MAATGSTVTKAEVNQKLASLVTTGGTYYGGADSFLTTRSQLEKLEARINTMRTERALMAQAAETYEREFLDRMETGRVGGSDLLARRGVSTLQDWVLLLFFAVYAAWLIVFIAYTLQHSTKKVFTIFFTLLFGPVFAVFIGSIILRFG